MGESAVGSAAVRVEEVGHETELLPDLPPTWVPKLAVARDMMDMRCPRVRWYSLFETHAWLACALCTYVHACILTGMDMPSTPCTGELHTCMWVLVEIWSL